MAQREDENQPEAPDLGASVQLENDEMLEGPAGDLDALDAGYVPPDRPFVLDDDAMTGRGMREGDTLDERLHREQGEVARDPDRSGRITIAGEGAALETSDALVGVDVGIDGGAASAEEAAMHEITDVGSPVELEPSVADSPALADPELDAVLASDPAAELAVEEAVRDIEDDGEFLVMGAPPVAEGIEPRHRMRESGDELRGGGSGDADPALPEDSADSDPAGRLDASPQAAGTAPSASGRGDAGPASGL